jgi:hypothetical protein
MRKLTDDELAAIRKDNQRTLYGGGERQREISSLFAHIAAQDSKIERLQAALERVGLLADVRADICPGCAVVVAAAKEALARLAGESETP